MTDDASRLTLHFLNGSRSGSSVTVDGATRLGRGADADVRLDAREDISVSGLHASLTPRDGAWFLEDHQSSNGTMLNEETVEETTLIASGDVVDLGRKPGQVGEGYVTVGVVSGTEESADAAAFEVFTFPCASCDAARRATLFQVGRSLPCRACGADGEVPAPGGAEPSSETRAEPAPAAGVWGALKNRFHGYRERRRLAGEVDLAESRLSEAKARANEKAAELASTLWVGAAGGDVQGLPAAASLAEWGVARVESAERLEQVASSDADVVRELEEQIDAWTEEAKPLQTAVDDASESKSEHDARLADARDRAAELFADQITPLGEVAARLSEVVKSNSADLKEDVCPQLEEITSELADIGGTVGPALESLAAILRERESCREDVTEAAAELRTAQSELRKAEKTREDLESSAAVRRTELEQEAGRIRDDQAQRDSENREALAALGFDVVKSRIESARTHELFEASERAIADREDADRRLTDLRSQLDRLKDAR